jgi:RNA polymerase sigma-70 factor (ECF subfamily)
MKYHQTVEQIAEEYEVIQKAIADPSHFEVLYNKYYDRIVAFVYQRLDDKEMAFDITSQVFLKALTHLPNYKFKGLPFSAWLFRIAYNELCDLFKRNEQYRMVNIDTHLLKELIEEADIETKEFYLKSMVDSISELPSSELELIEMRFFDEMSFREIGTTLGITENNAKVKVYRLLDKVKKCVYRKIEQDEKA